MDQSSESDEDKTVRHDRFRSERFQNSANTYKGKNQGQTHDRSSRGNNSRSPERSKRRQDPYSSSRNESRSLYDKKYNHYYDKSKSQTRKAGTVTRAIINKDDEENKSSPKKKQNLSSLLKSFDKKVEIKIKESDFKPEILVSQTTPSNVEEKNEKMVDRDYYTSIGPSLPSHRTNTDEEVQFDNEYIREKCSNINDCKTSPLAHCRDRKSNVTAEAESENIEKETYGPTLPIKLRNAENSTYNPTSDKEVQINQLLDDDKSFSKIISENECSSSYGPALPPSLKRNTIQGPTLPAGLSTLDLEKIIQNDPEEEDVVGPLPEGAMNMTQYQLDIRALELKKQFIDEKKISSNEITKREEWMLELPPEKATNLGLGPRTFRKRDGPDMSDRSSWTDTPADKLRKEEMAAKGESDSVSKEDVVRMAFVKEREYAMDKIAQQCQEREPQSLLDMHQKKLKKKKKKEEKEGKQKERRPFDRNIDLQVNRFDDAQKKAIFKKARLLDTRFSAGESKYL